MTILRPSYLLKGISYTDKTTSLYWIGAQGAFKNTYKFVNLRALKFSTLNESVSFNVWVRYFGWNFKGTLWNSTQNTLPIYWKMCSLLRSEDLVTLAPRFTSSCFRNVPRTLAHCSAVSLSSFVSTLPVTEFIYLMMWFSPVPISSVLS